MIQVLKQKEFYEIMDESSPNKAKIPIPRRMFICTTCHRVREVDYFVDPNTLFYTSTCIDCRNTTIQGSYNCTLSLPKEKIINSYPVPIAKSYPKTVKKSQPEYMTIIPQAKWISKRRLSSKPTNAKYHLAKLLFHRVISYQH